MINRQLLFFLLCFISTSIFSQNNIKDLTLEKNTIYLFCRGTKAKAGLIAEEFNSKDRKITHVGIGYLDDGKLSIFNVTDRDTIKTALVVDDLKSFISEGAFYLSVWRCKNTEANFLKLKEICSRYKKSKIYFDYTFLLNNKYDVLYCSEFCAKVLMEIDPQKFHFRTKKLKLDYYYQALLNRNRLVYYPVDFFEGCIYFSKVFETNFNLKKS